VTRLFAQPHSRPVNCLTFDTHRPTALVSSSYDGTVRSFDLQQQRFRLIYGSEDDDAPYAGFHAQLDAHTFLLSLGRTGIVGLVSAERGTGIQTRL